MNIEYIFAYYNLLLSVDQILNLKNMGDQMCTQLHNSKETGKFIVSVDERNFLLVVIL